METIYDLIIVGKSAGGLSASLYAKRSNLNVLVIGKDFGSLQKAEVVENFFGQKEAISGEDLCKNSIILAEKLGVSIFSEEVVSIEFEGNFVIKTANNVYLSKTILLATGAKRNSVNIEGIDKFSGSGVSFCAVCDGFFFRNKVVAVLGNGNYAKSEIEHLSNFAKETILVTNGQKPIANFEKFKVIETKISKLYGSEMLEGIEFEDGTKQNVDGFFVALGTAQALDFAKKLGIITEKNSIKVDENMATNIPGVFAAGDCTGGIMQISKAVYQGMVSAMSISKHLKSK